MLFEHAMVSPEPFCCNLQSHAIVKNARLPGKPSFNQDFVLSNLSYTHHQGGNPKQKTLRITESFLFVFYLRLRPLFLRPLLPPDLGEAGSTDIRFFL